MSEVIITITDVDDEQLNVKIESSSNDETVATLLGNMLYSLTLPENVEAFKESYAALIKHQNKE